MGKSIIFGVYLELQELKYLSPMNNKNTEILLLFSIFLSTLVINRGKSFKKRK